MENLTTGHPHSRKEKFYGDLDDPSIHEGDMHFRLESSMKNTVI